MFGGTNPITMSEYYNNNASGFTTGVTGIPNSGATISISHFYGKAKASSSSLYAFTAHTFTNASATGRTGPIISQARSAYSGATWAQDTTNNYLNMTTQGIQEWKVPATGSYTIDVAGAAGGITGGITPGYGARMVGTFNLTQGTVLAILVGQQGVVKTNGCNAGGGGGTFVWNKSSTSQPLIAGGGGGGGNSCGGTVGLNASTTANGTGGFGSSTAGSNGNGATPGGSGWLTNGTSGLDSNNSGCQRPLEGGLGGAARADYSIGDGGFGGGASASGQGCSNGGPGGGGGYSGGAGPSGDATCGSAGGGGSYNSGTSQTNTAGSNTGHGYVIITANSIIQAPTIPAGSGSGGLYTFTTHTFTNADSFGANGPILSQCRTSYSSASWTQDTTNNYLNMTTRGIQQWKVPSTGTYTIEMAGAAGGFICTTSTARPGYGYKISANISLTQGSVINIVVGQRGVGWPSGNGLVASWDQAAGGGGASCVFEGSTLYMIAAGGNGQSWDNHTVPDPDGQSTGASSAISSQGRGYKGATFNANGDGDSNAALSILNGAVGGNPNGGYASTGVYTTTTQGLPFAGGFGGGGGTNPYEGGGGGGYQGGIPKALNVYATTYPSQGATSYIAGTLTATTNLGTNTSGTLSDYTSLQGYVKITKV
jgi:hypothetical protein